MKARSWSAESDTLPHARRVWTAVYALTLLTEAVGLYAAVLLWSGEAGAVYILLPYTGVAVFWLIAGVLSLSMTSPEVMLRRLIWIKATALVAVWAVVVLSANSPYVSGSCADVRTGCVSSEDAARPVR